MIQTVLCFLLTTQIQPSLAVKSVPKDHCPVPLMLQMGKTKPQGTCYSDHVTQHRVPPPEEFTQEKMQKWRKRAVDRQARGLQSLAEALIATQEIREDFLKKVTSDKNWSEEAEKSIPGKQRRIRIDHGGGKFDMAGPQVIQAIAGEPHTLTHTYHKDTPHTDPHILVYGKPHTSPPYTPHNPHIQSYTQNQIHTYTHLTYIVHTQTQTILKHILCTHSHSHINTHKPLPPNTHTVCHGKRIL